MDDRLPPTWSEPLTKIAAFVVLGMVGVAAASWWPSTGRPTLSPMTVEREQGPVDVVREGKTTTVKARFALERGDVVVTGRGGLARLRLEGDRRIDLGESSRVRLLTTSKLESRGGRLLAEVGDRTQVRFGDVDAESRGGLFRVDSGFASARAGSYRGDLLLSASGQPPLTVPSLFEAPVAANDLPGQPAPYRLDPSDRWDRMWLGPALELDRELALLKGGLDAQFGSARPDLYYFKTLAGGKPVDFMKEFMDRPPADLVVGFTLAVHTPGRSLPDSFLHAFGLHDDGGSWGIVAAIMKARFRSLVAQLESLIARTGVVDQGAPERPRFRPPPAALSAADRSGTDGSTAGRQAGGRAGGDSSDAPSAPRPGPAPSPGPACGSALDCTLKQIVPSASPPPG